MASKRRREYGPIEKHPEYIEYHHYFDSYRLNSVILNKVENYGLTSILWDKTNIKGLLREIKGNEEGFFQDRNDNWIHASIPEAKERETAILQYFEHYKKIQRNEGREVPEVMPKFILDKLLKIQAKIDVLQEEAELLETKLQELSVPVIKTEEQNILQFGLLGMGSLDGGILAELDG